jgi:prolyl oligopeptidase
MTDWRPTLKDPDDDPFLWLEEVEGARATAWADAQSITTMQRFGDTRFTADRDELCRLLDRPDNLPVPLRRGGLLYNFWKDEGHPRGVWRRTSLNSYRTSSPDWHVLLDLDALAAAEGEDWIWQGAATLPPEHNRALVRLSRGGSDAAVFREFDLAARDFVTDGFVLPEAKGDAAWLDQDTVLLSTALGGATSSGYPSTVRLWCRGTAWSEGPILFQTDRANMNAWGWFDRPANRLIFGERTGFFDANVWFGDRSSPKQRVDLPTDALFGWDTDWLAVRGRTAWTAGTTCFQPDEVVVIRLNAFLAGDRGFTKVFPLRDPGSPSRDFSGPRGG